MGLLPVGPDTRARRQLRLRGAVQGVGFRPFVYRLARELGLAGFVSNAPGGVTIEVEGAAAALDELTRRVITDAPPAARPELIGFASLPSTGDAEFVIRESEHRGAKTAMLL